MIFSLGSVLKDYYLDITDDELMKLGLTKGSWQTTSSKKSLELIEIYKKRDLYKGWSLGGSIHNSCRILNQLGIETYNPNDKAKYHGVCLTLQTPDKERTFLTSLGESQKISLSDEDYNMLERSKYLFIEGYMLAKKSNVQIIQKLIHDSKIKSKKIILSLSDQNLIKSHRNTFCNIIRNGAYMVIGNKYEFNALDLESSFLTENIEHTYQTLGSQGSNYNSGTYTQEALQAKIVDKNGAGDSFAAGIIYCDISALPIQKSLKYAAYLSSLMVSVHGTQLHNPLSYYSFLK